VNERLFDAALLDALDACMNEFDDAGAAAILVKVELSPEDARATVAAIRRDPAKYVFQVMGFLSLLHKRRTTPSGRSRTTGSRRAKDPAYPPQLGLGVSRTKIISTGVALS